MSMEFSRQEYWIGLPFPSLDPNRGIEPRSPALQTESLPTEPLGKPSFHHIPTSTFNFFFFFPFGCGACVLSHFSRVWLFAKLWTIAHQAPLSTGFSRQEYWSGLPCPPPGDLSKPGTEPLSLVSLALADVFFTTHATCLKVLQYCFCFMFQGFGGRHLGSYLPDQGLNLYPRHWKVKS